MAALPIFLANLSAWEAGDGLHLTSGWQKTETNEDEGVEDVATGFP